MPISNAIRATESEMEYIEKYRQVQFIAKQVGSIPLFEIALIPSPSPSGRREPDLKSLSLRERDLG